MERQRRPVLTRPERTLVLAASGALVLVTVGNTLLMASGRTIPLYLEARDGAVILLAVVLVAGNLAALRRNPRQVWLFAAVLGLLAIVGTAHLVRLLHGGFACR
jgi:hypothetical protein